MMKEGRVLWQYIVFRSVLFTLLSRKRDQGALASSLSTICLPHQDGGILLNTLLNGTTTKLATLFSTLPCNAGVEQGSCEYQHFKVIDLNRLGIKPKTTGCRDGRSYHLTILALLLLGSKYSCDLTRVPVQILMC